MQKKGQPLSFKNGKFKVMQITDMQESAYVAEDTLKLINAALDREKPDLVVYTGDQIKGYSASYAGKNKKETVEKTLKKLLEPVTKRGIPFAPTFGNHDRQTGVTNDEQMQMYLGMPNCAAESGEVFGSGTYTVPIAGADGKTALNIYMIDSGGDAKGGGYEAPLPEQIEWYKSCREKLKDENGEYVPSIVFQHIPVCEHYEVLRRVDKKDKGAVRAYRTHKNEYYVPDEKKAVFGEGFMLEPPSIPDINTGEFEAIKEKGEVFGIYVGHDHKNSFVGRYEGVDFGYTQSAGFNVYGAGTLRGVRVFEFNEENPAEYETRTLTFRELVGKRVKNPIKDFAFSHAPTTTDDAIAMAVKALGILVPIAAVIAGLIWLL